VHRRNDYRSINLSQLTRLEIVLLRRFRLLCHTVLRTDSQSSARKRLEANRKTCSLKNNYRACDKRRDVEVCGRMRDEWFLSMQYGVQDRLSLGGQSSQQRRSRGLKAEDGRRGICSDCPKLLLRLLRSDKDQRKVQTGVVRNVSPNGKIS
jgi:hypothetical protein